MKTGEVTSDRQAFDQIRGRAAHEIGAILALADSGAAKPFWALPRVLFPVAESIGDLIHQDHSTGNLQKVLENEFESIRPGYRKISATLAMLFRHSLTHTDEMRGLVTNGREIFWCIAIDDPPNHLAVKQIGPTQFLITLVAKEFFSDILAVCDSAAQKNWGGKIRDRYNSWLGYDLDAALIAKPNGTLKRAITEIAAF